MKTAVLTGSSSGIGQAIKNKLTESGWRVISIAHTAEIPAEDTYQVDLSDLNATAKLGAQLASNLEQVDAFIHVAGIWHDDKAVLADKKLSEFTPQEIAATMNVGVSSAMIIASAIMPMMKSGTVIGISGTFTDGAAGWLPYYTSKRALEDFLVGLSQDYSDLRVMGYHPPTLLVWLIKSFILSIYLKRRRQKLWPNLPCASYRLTNLPAVILLRSDKAKLKKLFTPKRNWYHASGCMGRIG